MHLCKELSCAVHRLTRAVQMYWLAHLASASLVPRPLAARRRADCFMAVCALGRTHSMWAVSCTFLRFVVNVVLANVALASAGST